VPDDHGSAPSGSQADRLDPPAPPEVVLTKAEAFRVCQVLADAGRGLVRSGRGDEAEVVAAAFALLEERLTAG